MTLDAKLASRIDAALNEANAIALLKGAVACNSITGNEANFVEFLSMRCGSVI
jgi:acetylornithine deacetylase